MATNADQELAAYLLAGAAVGHAIADFASAGALSKVERNTLLRILRKAMPPLGRFAGRQALTVASTAGMVARRHPALTAGAIAYIAHTQGVSLDTARAIAEQEVQAFRSQPQFFLEEQVKERIREFEPTVLPGGGLGRGQPAASRAARRKISRANTAVKQGMKWLRAGTKAATGAVPGILPARAFRTTVIAAGMANPRTKSKPGKGKSIMNKLARRLKKWW